MTKCFIFLLVPLCLISILVHGQTLERKAWMGIITHEEAGGLAVDSVVANSTSEKLGLKKKDVLISVNEKVIHTMKELSTVTNDMYANAAIRIVYQRNSKVLTANGITVARPLFKAHWCEAIYGSIPAIGCTVRTIIYKPKKTGLTPGIFFIPGYNCGSIEGFQGNFNGKMIEEWVKKGYTVYTVEKSGLGDSYGCKACVEVDLQTDIELFETAYHDFSSLSYLDRGNLFIWGHSMGGIIAPIVAKDKPVKGIMVFGTVFRPWSEFLLEMHRVQKPLTDSLSYAQTEDFTRLIQKVYYEFFILKKSPAQLHENPEYKSIVESELEYKPGKEDMWGRHWRFWQQLDSINLAKAWQHLNCNVLVLHGGADFIQCSAVEPYLIAEAVNQVHHGNATLVTIPGLDHLIMNSQNFPEAVRHMNSKEYLKGNFNGKLAEETLKWMESVSR